MGRLEKQFRRLYWPPLVKRAVDSTEFPGYKYEFFTGFRELNEYFTELCGADWMDQEWAVYWRNQHLETKNDDRRDTKYDKDKRVTPIGTSGPRRDIKRITQLCADYLIDHQNEKVSSHKLARHLHSEHGIEVHYATVWRILKRIKKVDES